MGELKYQWEKEKSKEVLQKITELNLHTKGFQNLEGVYVHPYRWYIGGIIGEIRHNIQKGIWEL